MKTIKFIILVFLISFFSLSCKTGSTGGGGSNSPAIQSKPSGDDNQPPTAESPILMSAESISVAANLDNNLYFVDDGELEFIASGSILKAGTKKYVINESLISYDATGDPVDIDTLPVVPTRIKDTPEGLFYCKEYTPDESYALGAQYKVHSEIYKDMDIISPWYVNQYPCNGITSVADAIFVISGSGHETINGVITDPVHIEEDEFIIHNFDIPSKTIMFNNNVEAYETNFIVAARQWILYNGLYYSENGYTWSESAGLSESATAMSGFQSNPYPHPLPVEMPYGESPVFLKLGIYNDLLWWIECNTGFLFKYDPAADSVVFSYRLYMGDGKRATGIERRESLKAELSENLVYFRDNFVVKQINLDTGIVDIFFNGDGEVMEF